MFKIDKTPENLGLRLYDGDGNHIDTIDTYLQYLEARCLIKELELPKGSKPFTLENDTEIVRIDRMGTLDNYGCFDGVFDKSVDFHLRLL